MEPNRLSLSRRHWILWDGECDLCCRAASWIRWRDRQGKFQTCAYQQTPTPPMTPALYAACENAVHVVQTDGTVLRAGRASLFILEQIGHPALAGLLRLPPFIWFVELGYKILAANRPFFANFLFRRDHSPEAPELPVTPFPLPQDKLQKQEIPADV